MNRLQLRSKLITSLLKIDSQRAVESSQRCLSTTAQLNTFRAENYYAKKSFPTPKKWPMYNEIVREPRPLDSPTKPRAVYYHFRDNVKYSPKKMWYICAFIRGLTVDEAIKQLSFITTKGAHIAKEILLEAQEKAIQNGFEFKSNMHVGECFCTKGLVIKGVRKHARYRYGEIRYFHTHFYVKLVEGPPPKVYYHDPTPKTGTEQIEKFIDDHRAKKIEWTS